MPTTQFKLTRVQRNALIREGHKYVRQHGGAYVDEIGDHIASILLNDERGIYNADDYTAIEIGDYAYGIANFITRGEEHAS